MTFFWTLCAVDAVIAAAVLFFFVAGVIDGSVSSYNMHLWLGILALLGVVIGGSLLLNSKGYWGAAKSLLIVLALPGALFVLFLFVQILLHPRWN